VRLFCFCRTGAPVVGCGQNKHKAGERIQERRTGTTNFSRAVSPLMRLAVAAVELWCQPSTWGPSLSPCFHKKRSASSDFWKKENIKRWRRWEIMLRCSVKGTFRWSHWLETGRKPDICFPPRLSPLAVCRLETSWYYNEAAIPKKIKIKIKIKINKLSSILSQEWDSSFSVIMNGFFVIIGIWSPTEVEKNVCQRLADQGLIPFFILLQISSSYNISYYVSFPSTT
jgi:hypothetical protein